MEKRLDFEGLAELLLGRALEHLSQWLPGGRLRGREYVCASLLGGNGDSCKINTQNGRWADFATGHKGGDLIALYAAIHDIKNGEAAKQLADAERFSLGQSTSLTRQASPPPDIEITAPPDNSGVPVMTHPTFGSPVSSWCYLGETGKPQFYVSRYEPRDKDGTPLKKQIVPWSWAPSKARFIQKGFPSPRPLYGLELLSERPDAPVLVVEGEKACEAARTFLGHVYVVVTWSHGVQSIDKTDWSPLQGRKILLWPDADAPGVAAMRTIGQNLSKVCPEVKVIDTCEQPKGWDAADSTFTWDTFVDWAKPLASLFVDAPPVVVEAYVEPEILKVEVIPPSQPIEEEQDDIGDVPASLASAWDIIGIAQTKSGIPICNVDNAIRVLEGWPNFKDLLWFDTFHCKVFTKDKNGSEREWQDLDDLNLLAFMQREIGLRNMTESMVRTATTIYAHRHPRNEPFDWMETLSWDGVPRVDGMFAGYLGAELDDYSVAASKNWWISLVSRIYHPGSKVDSMIILEGAQGRFKSTALNVIGGKWYTESHESVTSKDFYILLQGKMIIEISEMDAFSKADLNTIKKVITCQTDRFRPPYGRVSVDFPRRCIFAGTTNEAAYLKDSTGARRFWPLKIGKINIDLIKRDRDQLFAEAVHRYKQGESWYEMPASAALVQEGRRQHDEWETFVSEYCERSTEGTTVMEIAGEALNIPVSKLDIMIQRRITTILRHLGYSAKSVRRNDSIVRLWSK